MRSFRLQLVIFSLFLSASISIAQTSIDPFAPKKTATSSNPYGTFNLNSMSNTGTYGIGQAREKFASTYDWNSENSYKKSTGSTSTYDWKSGNSYDTYKDNSGSTYLNGNNIRTGSTWNTEYKSNGDMNGVDKKGNSWDYDRSTGIYNNYGTGEIRIKGQTLYKPKKK